MGRTGSALLIEERYGEIGTGKPSVRVRGKEYRLRRILARWMMDVPEVWTIDGGTIAPERHWIRCLDAEDRQIVVFEFDGEFDILSETRADSLNWEGEDFFRSRTR